MWGTVVEDVGGLVEDLHKRPWRKAHLECVVPRGCQSLNRVAGRRFLSTSRSRGSESVDHLKVSEIKVG